MQTVRSFDLFDTLIARRCVRPDEIFRLIEEHSGVPDFRRMRLEAERSVQASGSYSLSDVYRAMSSDFGIAHEKAAELEATELDFEFRSIIPVQQHISEVRPFDIIVSDMYLPREFIERVVRETCGLRFNPIYLTSHGKSTGQAWSELAETANILEHTGDNPLTDIASCEKCGIKGLLTTLTAPTDDEKAIDDLGFAELAQAIRTARLALWDNDAGLLALGRAQVGVNFPLLYFATLSLIRYAKERNIRKILFSSRDCFFQMLLFRQLAEKLQIDISSDYFLTSRTARCNPSEGYLAYFRTLYDRDTLVVDICGTGWSLACLFDRAGIHEADTFLMHYLTDSSYLSDHYLGVRRPQCALTIKSLVETGPSSVLEAMNVADHPSVDDVLALSGGFIPRFNNAPTTARYDDLVRFSSHAFGMALKEAGTIPADQVARWLDAVEPKHTAAVYARMASLMPVVADLLDQQQQEDAVTLASLKGEAAPSPVRKKKPVPKGPLTRLIQKRAGEFLCTSSRILDGKAGKSPLSVWLRTKGTQLWNDARAGET